jgi:16S rRNA U516 pseudouridylate synthase RsuA-like enzyme
VLWIASQARNNLMTLHRLSIGGLVLPDDLAPGEYRVLR